MPCILLTNRDTTFSIIRFKCDVVFLTSGERLLRWKFEPPERERERKPLILKRFTKSGGKKTRCGNRKSLWQKWNSTCSALTARIIFSRSASTFITFLSSTSCRDPHIHSSTRKHTQTHIYFKMKTKLVTVKQTFIDRKDKKYYG
jgi:hypothetical protein